MACRTWPRIRHKPQIKLHLYREAWITSPVIVSIPALVLFLAPLGLALFGGGIGNVWRSPGALMPTALIFMAPFVAAQLFLHFDEVS